MIYVTQGHEKGIGPEVFIKSFICLSKKQREQMIFICHPKTLETTLQDLKVSFKLHKDRVNFCGVSLECLFIEDNELPQSTNALNMAMGLLRKQDILVTMPTSKDQVIYKGKQCSGHTEYFRKYFEKEEISMVFHNENTNVLLVTDHIPLKDVTTKVTEDLIVSKVSVTLKNHPEKIDNVYFAGINPHAGEAGILGTEDVVISGAIGKLGLLFKDKNFHGPISGDVLFHERGKNNLLVYAYHDQGLAAFKSFYGLRGMNISYGLPSLRISVDHGTAFSLYRKSCADYKGCLNLLRYALNI